VKLDDITTEIMKKAIDIYVSAAYANVPLPLTVKSRIAFCDGSTGEDLKAILSHEVVERVESEDEPGVIVSYAVRLGNEKYPHMKLAIRRQRGDDYCFVVDAHDRLFDLASAHPDAPKAQELRDYNRWLKEEVETRWREADLPTPDES